MVPFCVAELLTRSKGFVRLGCTSCLALQNDHSLAKGRFLCQSALVTWPEAAMSSILCLPATSLRIARLYKATTHPATLRSVDCLAMDCVGVARLLSSSSRWRFHFWSRRAELPHWSLSLRAWAARAVRHSGTIVSASWYCTMTCRRKIWEGLRYLGSAERCVSHSSQACHATTARSPP